MKIVELRQYIEQINNRNYDKKITVVKGLSTKKEFRTPQSRVNLNELGSYKILEYNNFAFVPTTDTWRCLAVALSKYEFPIVVSPIYCTFRITDESALLPDFLYLWLSRPEIDRYARFHSWGSARENFNFADMQRILIPLPDIEIQRQLVNVWEGLNNMRQDNEAQAEPLMELCMSYLKKLREDYPSESLLRHIEQSDGRNKDGLLGLNHVRGISINKIFIDSKANMEGVPLGNYKVVKPLEFAFVTVTSRNGEKISLALNSSNEDYLVSATYEVFRITSGELLPEYLYLWFLRPEFDRYARFHSWGSARETFNLNDMKRVAIPIPPKPIQQAVVDIFNCAKESKSIAEQAEQLRKIAGPALMQKAIHY